MTQPIADCGNKWTSTGRDGVCWRGAKIGKRPAEDGAGVRHTRAKGGKQQRYYASARLAELLPRRDVSLIPAANYNTVPESSPALPPSSPPTINYDVNSPVAQWPSSPPTGSSSTSPSAAGVKEQARLLLSPETARLPAPPQTPRNSSATRSNHPREVSSEYYTAAWGSPYEFSPSTTTDSARTALSRQPLFPFSGGSTRRSASANSHASSSSPPAKEFSLEHLIPSRFAGFTFPQPAALSQPQRQLGGVHRSAASVSHLNFPGQQRSRQQGEEGGEQEDNDLTPRSRTKRWVQLPRARGADGDNDDEEQKGKNAHWWSDESSGSSGEDFSAQQQQQQQQKRRKKATRSSHRASSVDSVSERQGLKALSKKKNRKQKRGQVGHKSRESNRTLDQQSFWLQEKGAMSSLYASRWADPPAAGADAASAEDSVTSTTGDVGAQAAKGKGNEVASGDKSEVEKESNGAEADTEGDADATETSGLMNSRWADPPPPSAEPQPAKKQEQSVKNVEETQPSSAGLKASRWADTPSPSPSPPPPAKQADTKPAVESATSPQEAEPLIAVSEKTQDVSEQQKQPTQPKPSLYESRWAATPPPPPPAPIPASETETETAAAPPASTVENSTVLRGESTTATADGVEGEERKEKQDLIDLDDGESKKLEDSVLQETEVDEAREEVEKKEEAEPEGEDQKKVEENVKMQTSGEASANAAHPVAAVAGKVEERDTSFEKTGPQNGQLEKPKIGSALPPTVSVINQVMPESAESKEQDELKALPSPGTTPAPPSPVKARLEPPRLKRKISWRGKTCVICLPNIDYAAVGRVKPLSTADVQARLKQFEDAGYNTTGFDLPAEIEVSSHAKPIYPDEAETKVKSAQEPPYVQLPDLQRWKAYMDGLTEQKLAALGVSIGPEEPAPASNTSQTQETSRQSSTQYPPLPFSPPISSASAASVARPGLTRGHSATMSVASPMSPFGHMQRQSSLAGGPLAFMNLQQAQSPFQPDQQTSQQQQQPMAAGMQSFSPLMQNQFSMPGMERTMSPPQVTAFRNLYGQVGGPGSPFNQQQALSQDKFFGGDDGQGQQGFGGMPSVFASHSNSIQPTPMLPQLPEEDDEDELLEKSEPEEEEAAAPAPKPEQPAYVPPHKRAQLNANISAPTPRGHRHNISEGLERDVMQTEQRKTSDKRERLEVEETTETGGDSEATDNSGSVMKTKAEPEKDPLGSDVIVREALHSRKKSSARFNVAAPAFSFNPAANFQPSSTAFDFTAQSNKAPAPVAAPAPAPQQNGQFIFHGRQKSSGTFNAAAPAFQPSGSFKPASIAPVTAAAADFDFSAKGKPTVAPSMPTSDFDFEAPVPMRASLSSTSQAAQQSSAGEEEPKGIFGKISIPDIIKPSRKSKAIAIVRPDDASKSASGTEYEDESGRLAQREDRMKRPRKHGADDDEVPRFAEPTPEPEPVPIPEAADFVLKSTATPPVHSPAASSAVEQVEEKVNEALGEIAEKGAETVEEQKAAARSDDSPREVETAHAKAIGHGHKKSSSLLSAMAKPFEMPAPPEPENKPAQDPAKLTVHEPKESFASISDLEEGEIREQHDGLEPPEAWRNGLTPTPPVLPDFPFENLPPGIPNEPSFDEIDEVMRQLNSAEEGVSHTEVSNAEVSNGDMSNAEGHSSLQSRSITPLPMPAAAHQARQPMDGVEYLPAWPRSDAPSPSPGRRHVPYDQQHESSLTAQDRSESEPVIVAEEQDWPPINRLNKAAEAPTSDWSDMLSAPDEAKLQQRTNFFDSHVESLIGRAIERRLMPLESSLRAIQTSVAKRPVSSSDQASKQRSSSTIESDADDEDDFLAEQQRQRPISRGRDKRIDQIKAVVMEALREQAPPQMPDPAPAPAAEPVKPELDLSELHAILADMKMSFARAASNNLELDDVRAVVQEALSKQAAPVAASVKEDSGSDKEAESSHKRELSELEGRLNETLAAALEEANLRRQTEEREAETRRVLRIAEEELQQLRDTNWGDDERVRTVEKDRDEYAEKLERAKIDVLHKDEERDELLARIDKAEIIGKTAEQERDELLEKLQYTEIVREAEEKARADLSKRLEKADHQLSEESESRDRLLIRVERAETMLNERDQERDALLMRLDDAATTSRARDQQIKDLEAEHAATHATLDEYRASSQKWRHSLDDKSREHAEMEHTIDALQRQLDESHESGGSMRKRLEALHADMAQAAGQLASEKAAWREREDDYRGRCDALEGQKAAYLQERNELLDELRSLRVSAAEAADAKAMMDQVKSSNSSLAESIRKMQSELLDQQALTSRYERDFNDARESARIEVQRTRIAMETDVETANHQVNIVRAELEAELLKARSELENVRMEAETAKARHERLLEEEDTARREALRKVNHTNSVALDETRQKHEAILAETRASHSRVLQQAREDKDRSEYILNERLSLADAKCQHYQDRVLHLEERLEVTKSAAQAAAMSAQGRSVSGRVTAVSSIPEKVSPQALRESILVLQEQLQERETRIEKLQTQVDKVAPAKLKAREDEVAWLRELLSVRSDELTGLINTLSRPTFDRDAVRDAAIRIRTTLQMEQEEKDRFGSNSSGSNTPPTISGQAMASLSNFASPRAASSISSAFNKWRQNMESSALKNAPRVNAHLAYGASARRAHNTHAAAGATPSKPPSSSAGASSAPPPAYLSGLMTPPATNLRSSPSPDATASLPPPRLQASRSAGPASAMSFPREGGNGGMITMSELPKPRSRHPSASSESKVQLFQPQSYDLDATDAPDVDVDGEGGPGAAVMEGEEEEGDEGQRHVELDEEDEDAEGEEDEDLDDVADSQPPAFRSLEDEMDDGGEEIEEE